MYNLLIIISFGYVAFAYPVSEDQSNECMPHNWEHAWARVGGVWYTFIEGPGTWQEMEKACRTIESGKSSLATMRNAEEQKHFADMARKEHVDYVWIGGARVALDWFFWYKDNGNSVKLERMPVTYWNSGEPSNTNNEEDCIQMYKNGRWNDELCHHKKSALCELRCY